MPDRPRTRPPTIRALAAIALVATAALLAGCAEPSQVTVDAPADRGPDDLPDGITVAATGEVTGAPDTMTVDFGVSVKRPTVQEAVDESARLATGVLDAVTAAGVAEADVQTREYAVSQEYRYPEGGEPVPDGFRVSNVVAVTIRDTSAAGATIDAVTTAGGDATVVRNVRFTLEEDADAQGAARADAMEQARAKAEQLADLGGRELGPAQAISDQPLVATPVDLAGEAARAFAADDATPIAPGEVTSSVTVRVRYELR